MAEMSIESAGSCRSSGDHLNRLSRQLMVYETVLKEIKGGLGPQEKRIVTLAQRFDGKSRERPRWLPKRRGRKAQRQDGRAG